MSASAGGDIDLTLALDGGPGPVAVTFSLGDIPDLSQWQLTLSPPSVTLDPWATATVRLHLAYLDCSSTLPSATDVIAVQVENGGPLQAMYPAGWDDSVVSAAATAAVLHACD